MAVVQPAVTPAPRRFGRYELRQMLGRTLASSTWLARDPRLQQDVLLCVPRGQPSGSAELEAWTQDALGGARLKHPHLAEVLEVGVQDGWPFVACARHDGVTLQEHLQAHPPAPPVEVATWVSELLEGLAYAHEAGVIHRDIGLHNVLLDKQGKVRLLGLGVGLVLPQPGQGTRQAAARQELRQAAERDVLMVGLLLHRVLANHPALDDADLYGAANRVGLEIVRLPWTTPHPVAETLRAIVNRATDRQQRQRYLNARTLHSALQGWLKTQASESGGALLLLLDRLNSVGSLPARPKTERASIEALSAETLHVDDLVDVVVKNPALVWEMLRAVNVASYRSASSDDGVATLSRACALLGQQGLRRVAGIVRPWPGALAAQASLTTQAGDSALNTLQDELRLACLAGHVARLMAPFSIHDEEACVAAISQRLGWLLVLYHFPDEASQIRRLMQASPEGSTDEAPAHGMSLEAASGAVLGVNLDDLSGDVLRHWGLPERIVAASRPLSTSRPVRAPVGPQEVLRTVASLANEMVLATVLEGAKGVAASHQAYVRYARALGLDAKECNLVLAKATRLVDQASLQVSHA